jgi:hypothetical protein
MIPLFGLENSQRTIKWARDRGKGGWEREKFSVKREGVRLVQLFVVPGETRNPQ